MQIWLNGEFVDSDEACISVFDAGFQHGVGLFETMLARHRRVFRAEAHLKTMAESARVLRLSDRVRVGPLGEAVQHTVDRNGLDDARVRVTVSGGDLNLLQSRGESARDPTVLIVAQPPTVYPDAFFERGVKVLIAAARANPWHPMAGHKTLDYWPRIRVLQDAGRREGAEAIWLSLDAEVASGCVSNVFVVSNGTVRTPVARGEEAPDAAPAPVRPGITRAVVLELAAAELDIEARTEAISAEDLFAADEVFMTNSSWGVLPVVVVEKRTIADGAVGPVTRRIRDAWSRLVDAETSARA